MTRPPNLTAVPKANVRPMTETEIGVFVACELLRPKPESVAADKLPEAVLALGIFTPAFADYFEAQVLLKRLALTDALYDPCTVALACIMTDRPGFSVLWAWTLFERGRELGRPYTIDDFTADFPMGPPTNEAAGEIWDMQKGEFGPGVLGPWNTDNALDLAAIWKETADAAL